MIKVVLNLIFGICTIGLFINLFSNHFTNYFNEKKRLTVFLLILNLLILGGINYYYDSESEKNDKYSKDSGSISGHLSNNKIQIRSLAIGGTVLHMDNLNPNVPFFEIFGSNKLNFWVENGEIKCNTLVRNEKGELIGELLDNEWVLNKDRRLDRNFDENSLEILDKDGAVVFQLYYDGEKANFQGVLRGDKGEGCGFTADKESKGASLVFLKPNEKFPFTIERMFKYPSDLHKGEKIKK